MSGSRSGIGRATIGALFVLLALLSAPDADAAKAPTAADLWVSEVSSSSARLHAAVNPQGASTSYRFEYLPAPAYEANLSGGGDGFEGAAKVPAASAAPAGSGTAPLAVTQAIADLTVETTYRYRIVVTNAVGSEESDPFSFVTQGFVAPAPDQRGWELVSPLAKNGGQVALPETLAGGGVLQAAGQGSAVTYSSSVSFGLGGEGAPNASQYLGHRSSSEWTTANLTTPMLSGSYGTGPVGAPYQLFSGDLARALLLNGRHCRDGGEGCPVANPPLAGTDAPAGYQNYYLRDDETSSFEALVGPDDVIHTSVPPEWFDLALAGAAPDLRHLVLSTCAALTADAVEVAAGEGCDAGSQNLYEWSGGGLRLVNLLPGHGQGSPGATLAAQSGAIAADGSRVYWRQGGELYLREGAQTKPVDAALGGGGQFETAPADGAVAFFTKDGDLYRFDAVSGTSTDLTPAGGVEGVLGASADGSYVYYLTDQGLYLDHGGSTTEVAADADAVNYEPATRVARVSEGGTRLAFVATAPLTGFDNVDQNTGERDPQVYLYDAEAGSLNCASCNPTLSRPLGPASIPGVRANGALPGSLRVYGPRVLTADGRRLFFESRDALVPGDSNGRRDVYEWEAAGTGDCGRPAGCLGLISSGRGEEAQFADASASGDDAYILTAASLVPSDPGSIDLYDARVGGGFPVPPKPIACDGDACQPLPSPPPDQVVTTLIEGPGNPKVDYQKRHHKKRHHKKRHHKKRHHSHRADQRGGRR
jgi:hypothetical protein